MKTLRLMTLTTLVLGASLAAGTQAPLWAAGPDDHSPPLNAPPDSDYYSPLAVTVRAATARFRNINVATAAGYVVPATACVSGPDHGAMGVHYANPAIIGSGALDLTQPAILIYEPQSDGTMQLVGVEYVLPLGLWTGNDPNKDPNTPPPQGATMPYMNGQQMNYQAQPNRYGQGNSFYLHLWAWRYNPKGLLSDWNPNVTCTK
jgi:hypothetical protein